MPRPTASGIFSVIQQELRIVAVLERIPDLSALDEKIVLIGMATMRCFIFNPVALIPSMRRQHGMLMGIAGELADMLAMGVGKQPRILPTSMRRRPA